MGSSIGVMIAQHLSEKVAECLLANLVKQGTTLGGEANVFVDDIFVSFDPSCGAKSVAERILEAVKSTSAALNVTFKFCHVYRARTCPTEIGRGARQPPPRPGHRKESMPVASKEKFLTEVETLNVLGVVFQPDTGVISLKDDFRVKLSRSLSKLDFSDLTPRRLWQCLGLCFYVIYAIGVCPSGFYGVFRCLSRVAKTLNGAVLLFAFLLFEKKKVKMQKIKNAKKEKMSFLLLLVSKKK